MVIVRVGFLRALRMNQEGVKGGRLTNDERTEMGLTSESFFLNSSFSKTLLPYNLLNGNR
jgi:hypothetical protein